MLIGYASEAVIGSSLHGQIARLEAVGCERVYADSGKKPEQGYRSGLTDALATIAPGDTLVVSDLPRLSRRIDQIMAIRADLSARGAALRILDEGAAG